MNDELRIYRLRPGVLRADAEEILKHANNPDRLDAAETFDAHEKLVKVIVSMLKQIRENDDIQDSIRANYSLANQQLRAENEELEVMCNDYAIAMRTIRRAVRGFKLGKE